MFQRHYIPANPGWFATSLDPEKIKAASSDALLADLVGLREKTAIIAWRVLVDEDGEYAPRPVLSDGCEYGEMVVLSPQGVVDTFAGQAVTVEDWRALFGPIPA